LDLLGGTSGLLEGISKGFQNLLRLRVWSICCQTTTQQHLKGTFKYWHRVCKSACVQQRFRLSKEQLAADIGMLTFKWPLWSRHVSAFYSFAASEGIDA
jgi:hypothetical protein